jgi:ATP-binding cassette subfamily B protein
MPPDADPPPLLRLWRYAGRHRPRILLATGFSVANKAFDLAPPFLIGVAVDSVVGGDGSFLGRWLGLDAIAQLWLLAAVTFAVWAAESLTEYLFQIHWRELAQTLQHELRTESYDHVQRLDMPFFEARSSGGLMSILNDDVNQLERFLDVGANDILQLVTTVLALGVFFFVAAPGVAWLAFLPIPLILWGSLRFQRRMAPRYARVRDEVGAINADLANNLGGIATIKSFTAEDRAAGRIDAASRRYLDANRHAIRLSSAFVPLIRMAIVLGFMATLVWGGRLAIAGTISVGIYSTLVFMTQRLLWPLTRLGQTFDLYQRAMASTRRIFALLDARPEMHDGPVALPTPGPRGEVRFERTRFGYPDGPTVLHDLDLVIPAGRTTAIVGSTGAGKSTLVKLALRFHDPQAGRVTLDDVDLRELSRHELRSAIGLVSQDVYLFPGSVAENLRVGRPDASDDDLERAAAAAEALDFVRALPRGFDTVVGERGQKLSGGQRQRLSIARAILKDPPIMIFDEATSAVDNETEAAIQRSLERITRGRTTIVIAHRLSTIRHADRIHVLEHGRLVESGDHDELVAHGGVYAGLWRVQTGARQATAR